VIEKKDPIACNDRALKVDVKKQSAHNSAITFQSQILNFQTSHVARRFGLTPNLAAIIAELAFSNDG
jgi:hypothetical protein